LNLGFHNPNSTTVSVPIAGARLVENNLEIGTLAIVTNEPANSVISSPLACIAPGGYFLDEDESDDDYRTSGTLVYERWLRY
jgi:hypothetical protein